MDKIIYKSCLVLGLLWSNSGHAQKRIERIPFVLTEHNNISVQAVINKTDTVQLMFHLATNALTLTEEAAKRVHSVNFDSSIDGIHSWGGSENESRISNGNLLQIGNFSWKGAEIGETMNSGPMTDGKFGSNLFVDQVIELDFEKQLLLIHRTLPKKVKHFEKLKTVYLHDAMYLEGTANIGTNEYKELYMVHSGYGGGLLLNDVFVNEHRLGEQLQITGEKILKDSFGNIIVTKKALLPRFTLGNQQLTNVPVGFFEGALGRQKMNIVGGDVIKRFHWVIDGKRDYIYLKTNDLRTIPYSNL